MPLYLTKGQKLNLSNAEEMFQKAWEQRGTLESFAKYDGLAVKEICIAAQLFGSLWLWNSVSEIFIEIVRLFPISIAVPKDYLTSNMQMAKHLKLGETQKAIDTISNYIERMDNQFSQFLMNINT